MTGWLAALRLARREARRAKGRSVLVVALIGLPVLGLSFAAATYDMFRLTPQEVASRELGAADASVRWVYADPVRQAGARGEGIRSSDGDPEVMLRDDEATAAEVAAVLPPGSTVSPLHRGEVRVEAGTAAARLGWQGFDLADPVTEGLARITGGRAPARAGEVALTAAAAQRLGIQVGDRIEADGRRQTVVGTVEFPGVPGERSFQVPGLTDEVVLFHPAGRPADHWRPVRWLVDAPAPVSWEQVRQLNQHGVLVYSRAVLLDPPPELARDRSRLGETFRTGVVVAGLAGLETVLLAGPAFAISARRRQRELALVAVAGGTPAHQRRIVLADGVVLGLAAAAAGLLLGVGAALAARPLAAHRLFGALPGGYRVYPLALLGIVTFAVVTGVLAALVPAFTAARRDVVAALAGRSGARSFRRRWLATGVVLAGVGAAVAGAGAWQVEATVVLAGLVLTQLGLALCVPALIGLVARLGDRLPVAARISLRDTARNRSAAAPAISAVMAAVAGAVTAGVVLVSVQARDAADVHASRPPGTVTVDVSQGSDDVPAVDAAAAEQAARDALPVAEVHLVEHPVCHDEHRACTLVVEMPEERRCPYVIAHPDDPFSFTVPANLSTAEQRAARADPRCDRIGALVGHDLIVDDGSALAALTGAPREELANATAVLRRGGAVVTDGRYLSGGRLTLLVVRYDEQGRPSPGERVTLPGYAVDVDVALAGAIVSPAGLAAAGLRAQPGTVVMTTTRMPTRAEEDAFVAAMDGLGTWGTVHREPTGRYDPVVGLLALAAGLIALAAAAIATALAAADRRADLSTLGAVGAAPRIRRAMSLHHSAIIAGLGTVLGSVAGLGASVAVLSAMNQRYADQWPAPPPIPVTVPWLAVLGLLAVPVVAMLGAGMLTRSRLPIERRTT